MPAGVRVDWVDCVCCGGAKCCSLISNEGVPFTPAEGFTLESVEVTNPNQYGCVGRAQVDVTLSKPADPGMNCSGSCSACGLPAGVQDQMVAEFRSRFEAMGYVVPTPSGKSQWGFPAGYSYPPELEGCGRGELRIAGSSNLSCPAGDVFSTINAAAHKDLGELNLGCVDPRAWFRDNHLQPNLATLRAAWLAEPTKILGANGGKQCEWWIFGAYTYFSNLPEACWRIEWNGSCWVAYLHKGASSWIGILYGVRCADDPCAMGDYNWPLELECVCTGEYERPNVSQTPICNLFLENTSREYSEDKCLFKATYLGALGSGLVDCDATPEADDCKCCGEGGP